jgi:hypothetical protein
LACSNTQEKTKKIGVARKYIVLNRLLYYVLLVKGFPDRKFRPKPNAQKLSGDKYCEI